MTGRASRQLGLLVALAVLSAASLRSDTSRDPLPPDARLAWQPLTLSDGTPHVLREFIGRRATVIVFLGIDCPIGNLYIPRLSELAAGYADRGIRFLGVNSNAHESIDQVAEHARMFQANWPIVKDPQNRLADHLDANRTCEAFVLDPSFRIVYRGGIDDQYRLDARKSAPNQPSLVEALEDVLAGREVAVASTPVVGCPIERVDLRRKLAANPRTRRTVTELVPAAPARAVSRNVTWSGEVATIMQDRCQSCHRPGRPGRFSLLSYKNAKRWAASIREVVSEGRMPPWHADPRYGHFANNRSLTPEERATLLAWVDAGAPAGDLDRQPPPRRFPDGWTIGTPDAVFTMVEPYVVAPEGTIEIQHFRVPTGFTEDRWVQAVEARPGDSEVVHHIVVFVDDHQGHGEDANRYIQTHLVNYAPGDLPSVFPEGTAKLVPAGSDLIFDVHYTPVGRAKLDRSSVALKFATGPITRRAFTVSVSQKHLVIPPGEPNYRAVASHTFTNDAQLIGVMPHMHLRGKDFLCRTIRPGGSMETFLSVPSYDFAWQSIYRLAEPLNLPRGSRIECIAHFDNSADNPANPDPTKTVRWGDQSWDEMMIGFVDYSEAIDARIANGSNSAAPSPRR
jgi:hypothetical protein